MRFKPSVAVHGLANTSHTTAMVHKKRQVAKKNPSLFTKGVLLTGVGVATAVFVGPMLLVFGPFALPLLFPPAAVALYIATRETKSAVSEPSIIDSVAIGLAGMLAIGAVAYFLTRTRK